MMKESTLAKVTLEENRAEVAVSTPSEAGSDRVCDDDDGDEGSSASDEGM